jgi:ribonuclease III
MPRDLQELIKALKIKFKNPELLKTALVHRSYINEHPDWPTDHNERLEFLGDAVLELVVTDHLYLNFSNPEGELTNWRAALVRGLTLKDVAEQLGLGEYLYLSRGEEQSGGRSRELILANTVESLIGAIYLDRGYPIAKKFIEKYIIVKLPEILQTKAYQDAKSHLQELSQDKFGVTPIYELISESGPDHAKQFLMAVLIESQEWGRGQGTSKQHAEQEAAADALTRWNK